MKIFSRAEWQEVLASTDPLTVGKKLSLNEYAIAFNKRMAELRATFPGVSFSNRRYVSHIENALEAGQCVPKEFLEDIAKEEIQFDWPAFPHLCAARGFYLEERKRFEQVSATGSSIV